MVSGLSSVHRRVCTGSTGERPVRRLRGAANQVQIFHAHRRQSRRQRAHDRRRARRDRIACEISAPGTVAGSLRAARCRFGNGDRCHPQQMTVTGIETVRPDRRGFALVIVLLLMILGSALMFGAINGSLTETETARAGTIQRQVLVSAESEAWNE